MAENSVKYDTRHGGPFDRGRMDSYYGRARCPHYFEGASYFSKEVTELTSEEIAAYNAGYDEDPLDKKDWR